MKIECADRQVFIVDAPLDVKLESEYLRASGIAEANLSTAQEAVETLCNDIIIPELRRRVNHAPEYATLRQAYRSLARWIKSQLPASEMPLTPHVDVGRVEKCLYASPTWDPRAVYEEYRRVYREGILNHTETETDYPIVRTHTYRFGGVDFTKVEFQLTSRPFSRSVRDRVERARSPEGEVDELGGRWIAGSHPLVSMETTRRPRAGSRLAFGPCLAQPVGGKGSRG